METVVRGGSGSDADGWPRLYLLGQGLLVQKLLKVLERVRLIPGFRVVFERHGRLKEDSGSVEHFVQCVVLLEWQTTKIGGGGHWQAV